MKRGLALDATGWLILGILVVLVVIGITLVLRDPVTDLLQDAIDRLRFG